VDQSNIGEFKEDHEQEGFWFRTNPTKELVPSIAQQIGSYTRDQAMRTIQVFPSNGKVKMAILKDLLMKRNQMIDIDI